MSLPDADVAICGAGIVGLSAARAIQRSTGATTVVFDKESRVGAHQSGHNSGVLHSGIYYRPGTQKASLVAASRAGLLSFCEEHDIAVDVCGKVIVATGRDELAELGRLARRAQENGIAATLLGPEGLRAIEPHAVGLGALGVPGAGIIDYPAVCAGLASEVQRNGTVELETELVSVTPDTQYRRGAPDGGVRVSTTRGEGRYRYLVNCAGLQSDRVSSLSGAQQDVAIVAFRGEYYDLAPHAATMVNHLIYPVPDPRYPFLGVHLTRDISDRVHAGPNAVLALAREGYERGDVSLNDIAALCSHSGTWRLASRHWRTGVMELLRSRSSGRFLADLRCLVPGLPDDALVPGGSGVRAQAVDRSGRLLDDFVFAEHGSVLSVLNAPSPAASASFAIGDVIAARFAAAQKVKR